MAVAEALVAAPWRTMLSLGVATPPRGRCVPHQFCLGPAKQFPRSRSIAASSALSSRRHRF
eukprot:6439673-Alexandrium_andersonii.AAC.1